MSNLKSLLFEIGVEEIPARFLPPAIESIKQLVTDGFKQSAIGFAEMHAFATPRRLALIVTGIPQKQEDRIREVFGPPKKVAFDADGKLTKAAEKFLSTCGVTADKLAVKKKDKGEYIVATIEEKGVDVKEVLPEILSRVITSLTFPKSMRWGDGTMRFARPIHWIVAVFGKDVIGFEIDGIKSGDETRGHRFLSPAVVKVTPENYIETLREKKVVVDQAERRKMILEQLEIMATEAGGVFVKDDELVALVTYIVEFPNVVAGSFEAKYLDLPDELLMTVMRGHQKYFAVRGADNKLMNRFLIVGNTKPENNDMVCAGAERVIRARFEDARFYFVEDRKKSLEDRVEELKRVTFHEKIGNLHEKTMRVKDIARFLAVRMFPQLIESIERAALLSKTDLITGVVREFPELQGIIGSYYATADKEEEAIISAMKEQYHYTADDIFYNLRTNGAIVNLSDKMDTLISFFSVGMKPTGSQDPFALRRSGLAIATILFIKKFDFSIAELVEETIKISGGRSKDKAVLQKEIVEFLKARVEYLLSAPEMKEFFAKSYSDETVKSVMPFVADNPLRDVEKRLDSIVRFQKEETFPAFLAAIKRIKNIAPEGELKAVDESLFIADAERNLFAAMNGMDFLMRRKHHQYYEALEALAKLTPLINAFFDGVMVMDKDEAVKTNRLSLLQTIWTMASSIVDFSQLA